jgi:purine-nucleoside phosphorylase
MLRCRRVSVALRTWSTNNMTDSGPAAGHPSASVFERASRAAAHVLSLTPLRPRIALILGSGLGAFADSLSDSVQVPYEDLPGFQPATVAGHAGKLAIGRCDGVPVIVMSGRPHCYEGYSLDEVTMPVRILRQAGVRYIFITNSSGGINPSFGNGDFMLIEDHLNLTGTSPLMGPNIDEFGPRFPDMTYTYDARLNAEITAAAEELEIDLKRGVYVGLLGPTYETPAEVRMLRVLGGDAVGMSTVVEVIVAHHAGMTVSGVSVVANLAAGLNGGPLDHSEIKDTANRVRVAFVALLTRSLSRLAAAEWYDPTPLPRSLDAAS